MLKLTVSVKEVKSLICFHSQQAFDIHLKRIQINVKQRGNIKIEHLIYFYIIPGGQQFNSINVNRARNGQNWTNEVLILVSQNISHKSYTTIT